jgi:hypothetical protein
MLTLRLTQKLASSLHVALERNVAPATNLSADWCCQRFTFSRSRFLLITNASTFYSVVVRAHGMGNLSDFTTGVVAGLRGYLVDAGHERIFTRLIGPESGEVRFVPIGDRHALGVMNEFIFMAKEYLEDLSPVETSDRLNACPVSTLMGKFPSDVFPTVATKRDDA